MNLYDSVQYLKGVGPKRAEKLKKIGIKKIYDVLFYFPRDYEDRSSITKIRDCKNKEKVTLYVKVSGSSVTLRPKKGVSITKIPIKDDTGLAYMVYFNQPYINNTFKVGDVIRVNGRVNISYGQIQIQSPIYSKGKDNSRVGSIVPIYPLTNKLTNNEMIKIIKSTIKTYTSQLDEIFSLKMRDELNLISIDEAIKNIHFPTDRETYKKSKYRLVFEEFLILQLGLFLIKSKLRENKVGIEFHKYDRSEEFLNKLPFNLTSAQYRVFKEIKQDMESTKVMNRLVQGDVGSGKTIIAILAMLKSTVSGYQSVMMAPTEILATQHYDEINKLLKDFGIRCELLVGSLSAKEKLRILEDVKNGNIDILVGTHALIQDGVDFKRLGLAITDEQHRFGVRQRAKLSEKGKTPDVLVMTATPIPRTLAMILYGDLDISIIDELPPGRKKIDTYAVNNTMKSRVFDFVKKQIVQGRQAYIVCPLVEESETLDLQSATEVYQEIDELYKDKYSVGLLHGKMKPSDKEDIMNKFKEKEIDILVSTTVIEVGVNVPNSNIMVIMNSERFGLAQLHQLRGRVGRGEYKSYCILINESKNKVARERMRIMEKTTDGFIISEKDLELRGPGEFFGTKQHGIPELKIANIFTDMEILKIAQKEAQKILLEDATLNLPKNIKIRNRVDKLINENLKEISFN
ncbi:ATP-dependent DNA helicase RecG [Clostridium sp. D2Q-11]|uniref:ATP-dependent DNA helicase RecG n=1 Tax=Anaeromonas frigoriresistens TaxID=2683708 RepID=A0A942UZN7_9FIRM|nr:ATP-dependent DNA helicase RecG [Anaeromonas frigoriresistens]MBS4539749.1 ATP-dependent DNA helicase RecG [Anaeromonas frigoriresistens]